jgi:DNA-binding Lrp family transcriptional regulator
VTRRVETLLNDRILTISAIPNPNQLGFQSQAIIALSVPPQNIRSVCSRLKSNFNVNLIVTTFGRYNLVIMVFFVSWNDLHHFISQELYMRSEINEIDIFFVKEALKVHYGFSKNIDLGQKLTKIDTLDRQIIEALTLDGRQSCRDLADQLGISLSSVSKRLAVLLKGGVITVQAQTTTRAGYRADAFLFIKADHKSIEKICVDLQAYDEVLAIMTLLNGFDVFVSVIAENTEMLYESIRSKFEMISGISGIVTLVRGEIVKRYYGNFRFSHQIFDKQKLGYSRQGLHL